MTKSLNKFLLLLVEDPQFLIQFDRLRALVLRPVPTVVLAAGGEVVAEVNDFLLLSERVLPLWFH